MNTEKIVTTIKQRFDHASSKKVLKEKYFGKMLFAYNEGMWTSGPELINILSNMNAEEIVLLDIYDTPVKVTREELLIKAKQIWQEQLNAWLVEHAELQNKR